MYSAVRVRLGALFGFALVTASFAANHVKPPPTPMDALLISFQKQIRLSLKKDSETYESLRIGAPRTVFRWKGDTHRFPPIPPLDPSVQEIATTYPLSALPAPWIVHLNEIGSKLFQAGMRDGAANRIGKLWQKFSEQLADTDVPRSDIPELGEVLPGYSSKRQYAKIKLPFTDLKAAQTRAHAALKSIPGSSRALVLDLPEEASQASELLSAFQDHERQARQLTEELRLKLMGQTKRMIVDLQLGLLGELQAKLGRPPQAEDMRQFAKLMAPRWLALVRWNHARHYFGGYRATFGQVGRTGTGDGTSTGEPVVIPGGGTGSGTGGSNLAGTGTGTGTGDPPPGGVPGGGTGDGNRIDTESGTGTGEG